MIYNYDKTEVIFEEYDNFDKETYRSKIYDYGVNLDYDEIRIYRHYWPTKCGKIHIT